MGVASSPKWKETEGKEEVQKMSDQKCFNHHDLYIGYNVTNVYLSAIKVAKRSGGFPLEKWFTIAFPTMLENAPLQTSLESFNLMSLAYKRQ